MSAWIITAGAFFAMTSVMLGAFAAHGLKGKLSDAMLNVFHTAAQYQMYHGLALILCGLYYAQIQTAMNHKLVATSLENGLEQSLKDPLAGLFWLKLSAFSFVFGIIFFSGSLYGLSLSGQKWLGPITPIGGLFFIAAWGFLMVAAIKN